MSTIREQIVAAAVTALTTGKPSGVPTPVRTRIDSPDADQLPCLTVYQGLEKVESAFSPKPGLSRHGPIVKRTLDLVVEVLTKAGSGGEPDKLADPSLAWATKALCAEGALSLAKQPVEEVGTKFEYEQGETSFCRATQVFRIQYQSRVDDAERVT